MTVNNQHPDMKQQFKKQGECSVIIGEMGLAKDAETIQELMEMPNSVGIVGKSMASQKNVFFLATPKNETQANTVRTIRRMLGIISVTQGYMYLTAVDSMDKVPKEIKKFNDLYEDIKNIYCLER